VLKKFGFLVLLLVPAALVAQSPRSATGGEASFWAGGEFSVFNPDYGCSGISPFHCGSNKLLMGPTALFDYNLASKWGVEGEARWLHWHAAGGEKESNYLLGPRYRFLQYHGLNSYAKVLLGGGWITTPGYPQAGTLQGSYFDTALGATADYSLTRRIAVRADYEFQFWPSFAGPPTYNSAGQLQTHSSGLTPNGISVGVVYKILGQ